MPDPLAKQADLEVRLGHPLSAEETIRAQPLLGDASALVRSFTRQSFDLVEDDEITLRPVGTYLRLPQRPVIDVTSVIAVGCDGLPDIPLSGWCWDGIDIIDIAGLDSATWVSLPEWWHDLDGPNTYRVVYSHGYPSTPPEVVAVVASMVLRVLTAPSLVEGMVSERIGQYNWQAQQGMGSAGVNVRLTKADKDALVAAGYKRQATTVQVRL
jgi:hypothetical protein